MSLLTDALAFLARQQVPAAVIGGVALAAHGIARATLDTDLFVVDARVLTPDFWEGWSSTDQREDFRGDRDEPLAGTVRLARGDEIVDIVVGRPGWQSAVLERRTVIDLQSVRLPVVDRVDLILLKLLAGGPQDLLDVELLIASDPIALRAEVESRLGGLPTALSAAWRRMRDRQP
jgi:hypothetical protein